MVHGYVEDGEFTETENKKRAVKCDVCGEIVEESDVLTREEYQNVRAEALFPGEDLKGIANVCRDCILEGIGEEGAQKLKEEVYEEKEEDTVEL